MFCRTNRKLEFNTVSSRKILFEDDPYLVDCVTAKIFPHVNSDATAAAKASAAGGAATCLQLVSIRGGAGGGVDGDRTVSLPSLQPEQNYSQMLSELVLHI